MKTNAILCITALAATLTLSGANAQTPPKYSADVPASITTPDTVRSIHS